MGRFNLGVVLLSALVSLGLFAADLDVAAAKAAYDALINPPPVPAKALNLSTRVFVDTGERVSIAGDERTAGHGDCRTDDRSAAKLIGTRLDAD